VEFKDLAGNSGMIFDTITLDTIAPSVPTLSGTTPTNDTMPTWSWTSGGSGGSGTYRYKIGSGNWSQTIASSYTPASAFSGGAQTLYVQERDAAGNWSSSGSQAIVIIDSVTPASIPYSQDFEGLGTLDLTDSIAPLDLSIQEWEYSKTQDGRLRTDTGYADVPNGTRALTLDATSGETSENRVTLHLNLSPDANATNLILSFKHKHHTEEEQAGDRVWIRGSNSGSWLEASNLHSIQTSKGVFQTVTLDLDAVLAGGSQVPTSDTQIRFGQEDGSPTQSNTTTDGRTFDDILVVALPTPGLDTPADAAYTKDTTPTFSWTSVTDANYYNIQVDNNSDFSSPVADMNSTSTSSTVPALSDGTYYWRVRAGRQGTLGGGDAWGNWAASRHLHIDTTPPTMTITASEGVDGFTSRDATLSLTFTSSEVATNFTSSDITVSNGSISNFSGSGSAYTATFTPAAQGACAIDVAANKFTDAADNNNTAATQFNWAHDTTGLTIKITAAQGSDGFTSNDGALSLTFTSSKATSNFASSDVSLGNGSVSNFNGSGTTYTATFTPTAQGPCTIDIAATKFTGPAGNSNFAATQFNWTHDTIAPAVPTLSLPSHGLRTNDTTPILSWVAVTGASQYQIQVDDNLAFSHPTTLVTTATSYTWGTLAEDTWSWRVRATDAAGNWSSYSSSRKFKIDTTAPTGTSISVNGGATYTTSTGVTLTLAATDASQMRFKNGSGGTWSTYEAYATSKAWTLGSVEGTRTVYVQFKDAAGNVTGGSTNDTIILDTIAPVVPTLTSPAKSALVQPGQLCPG
jgi:hypothetical protein